MDLLRRLCRRIGRRGAALLFFAFLDLVYGLSLLNPPATARPSPTLVFIAHVMPLAVWGGLWTAVGLVCLTGWWIAGLERGWLAAAIWLAMAAWVMIIASWAEPMEVPILTREDVLS
jgi:uncharacterized membrane protein YedE/YeeE